jgi:hypothetical protein
LPASGQVASPRPSVPQAGAAAAPPRVPTIKPEQRADAAPPARPPARVSGSPPRRRGWLPVVLALLAIVLASVGAYAAVKGIEGNRPNPTPTASATSKPTATHTATATATSTATPSPTSTTPAPTVYTASQFVPAQSDLPGNTTPLSPVTATTPDQFNQSNSGRVVNPTQGYNWQEDISEQIDKSGSKYLFVAIDQFATAADATNYFNAVAPHLKQTQQQQIGDQEIDGLCCDNLPTNYNVFYRDHNVTVIILVDPQNSSQANQDAIALAKKTDQHVRPSSALLQVDRFALHRRDESNARSAAE